MKTTFSRQFALIAALLLVCMIFTGVSFRFLMLGYLKNDKKETLSADAAAVASLAEAYDSTGELEENWDFRLSLSLFSDVGEAEALVCDENGFVVLCSCDEFNCEHIGQQVDANLITEIDANGETFRVGALSGDDLLHVLGSDRFQVGGIRELGIGHDGRRVRIDQNDPVALFPQHPAGLGAGVVEFGGLADDDRSRADHHDRADVCAPRHQ